MIRERVRRILGPTRVRITLVAVIAGGVAITLGGIAFHAVLEVSGERAVRGPAVPQVAWIERIGSSGRLPNPLPPADAPRLTLVQVVESGRPITASEQLADAGVELDHDGDLHEHIDRGVGFHRQIRGGPWFVESRPAVVGGRHVTVIVLTSLAESERTLEAVDTALLIALPALLALVAATTWWLVGRSLRPVERMRLEVEQITARNLDSRVQEPSTKDEIGRLAHTLNSMLERLQRSAERQRRFVADASHELRTPVANVATALDVARRYPDRTDWPDVAEDVAAQNSRMARLVADLLLIAQSDHPGSAETIAPVAVATVVRRALSDIASADRSMIHLAEPLADPLIESNASKLQRVLSNLLENAVRHANDRVDLSILEDNETVAIVIDDDGPGIPEQDRERVFQPFVRLDAHRARPQGGAGLGLAIARDAVIDLGGSIALDASPRGGARFTIGLPRRPVDR